MIKHERDPKEIEVNAIILDAVSCIKENDQKMAVELLKKAASIDVENPEVYNLLGIIYERNNDMINATKYYRVAYYMDQSFKAAGENLDRLNNLYYKGFSNISWGLERIGGNVK